jgi:hypothetical protein
MTKHQAAGIVLLGWASLACLPALAETPATRYIPLQLIIGDTWNGEQSITYPVGRFVEGVRDGAPSIWVGPKQWAHPKTGRTLTVYFRERDGRNAARQIFAVRDDQTAIGRVADSRFGITACDQEGKYPLGVWRQGEVRSFEYSCWFGDRVEAKVTTITIQELDYTCDGIDHCLRVDWVLRDKGSSSYPLDHRVYVFAPNHGVTREYKAQ